MLIFLYGPDSYRRRRKIKEIIKEHQKKHLFSAVENFNFENGDNSEFLKLQEFFFSPTLFESVKLAVTENILSAAKENKKIVKLLKENLENKNFVLVISEDSVPTKDFKFLLEKPVLFQNFENFEGKELEQFIKKEAIGRGLELDTAAVLFLADIFQGNSWGLVNELDKLSLLNSPKISLNHIKEIIGDYDAVSSPDFFKQVSAFTFARSLEQKIINLEILLNKEDSAKIFNILASFSSNSINLTRKFADYDMMIKSGKIEYEEALIDIVLI